MLIKIITHLLNLTAVNIALSIYYSSTDSFSGKHAIHLIISSYAVLILTILFRLSKKNYGTFKMTVFTFAGTLIIPFISILTMFLGMELYMGEYNSILKVFLLAAVVGNLALPYSVPLAFLNSILIYYHAKKN